MNSIQQKTVSKPIDDKLITHRITSCRDLQHLVAFPDEMPMRNEVHWASWLKQCVKREAYRFLDTVEKIEQTIQQRMVPALSSCSSGQLAQMSFYVGRLGIENRDFNDWRHLQAEKQLAAFSPLELYLFFHGMQRSASQEELHALLEMVQCDPAQVCSELKPSALISLLRAHSAAVYDSPLRQAILEKLLEVYETLDSKTKIDLIAGTPRTEILQKIAQDLSHTALSFTELRQALAHFLKVSYLPRELIPSVQEHLAYETEDWKSISLFFLMAEAGFKEEFVSLFKSFETPELANLVLEDVVRLFCSGLFFRMSRREVAVYLDTHRAQLTDRDWKRLKRFIPDGE